MLIFCRSQVKEQDCISPNDSKGENYYGITNTAGGISCMTWGDIWQPNWNSKLTYPKDGLNHNYCRNIIGSQFPQPWCMVKKPIEGPTAVQCSIPKCSQRQPQVDIFPTALPMLIVSTTPTSSASDYGSTEGTTKRPARPRGTTAYIGSTVITSTTPSIRPTVYNTRMRTYTTTDEYTAAETTYTLYNTSPMTGKKYMSRSKELQYIMRTNRAHGTLRSRF